MAEIKISALPGPGTPQGTDLTPATDTTDTSSAASGTTKKYTRSSELNFYLSAQGLTTYSAVLAATIGALTATYANGASGVGATLTNSGAMAALTLDGVTLVVSDRVLVKNQATAAQNGIYTVTTVGSGAVNWVLTRATDYDQAAEVVQYGVVLVNQGTVNAGLLYQETGAGPFTIGTTDITFAAFSAQSLTLPVSLAQGGTSASLVADNGGVVFSNATTLQILASTSTANQMLMSGASQVGGWSTATWPIVTTINQILYSSAANTVTGLATANQAVLTTGLTGTPVLTALAADGQLIVGSTAGVPAAATLTPGTGISIANGSNTITISATGGGFGIATIAGTTQTAAVNTMYIALNAGQTTLTLPATYSVGDSVLLVGSTANTGGWIIQAEAGDTVRVNNSTTSAGGTVTSSAVAGQTIELVADVADTSWVMMDTSSVTLTTA